MIYILYILVAAGVVYLSMKASDYVDFIDKKTSLSGAFIGGVMLSAVTSLPELFTSISATIFLDKPGLCIGNILGSNLLNIAVLAVCLLFAFQAFHTTVVSKSHSIVIVSCIAIYAAIYLNMSAAMNVEILTISTTSIIIFILYILAVKNMSSENGATAEEQEDTCSLTLKQIVIRFILVSVGIIVLSIVITYITDEIANRLHLGTGLAGALFLGIATSLPEVSSTIALIRKKNFNIAIGNIVGSNLFNFLILCIADVVYLGNGIYDFTDPKTGSLLLFGAIGSICMFITFRIKNKNLKICTTVSVAACYLAFLVL